MRNIKQKHYLFILLALIVSGLIAYFGFRTIEHEALLRRSQDEQIALNKVSQVKTRIQNILKQKSDRIEGAIAYLTVDAKEINKLIEQETDINAVFAFKPNELIYPKLTEPLSEKAQLQRAKIMPIVYDASLLYSHSITSDVEIPKSGWFISRDNNDALLIYWLKKNNLWFAFEFSYSYFLSEVINMLDDERSIDFMLIENDRTLVEQITGDYIVLATVQNNHPQYNSSYSKNMLSLDYPLNNWRIEYYTYKGPIFALYFVGIGIVLAIILFFCGFLLYVYREYQRTAKQAAQQVNFVGQVSHELKTPLTNILLYTELLKESLGDEAEAAYSLEVISSESRRLSRLIQNVLSFTRAPEIHAKKFEVNELINHIHQLFSPVFSARKIQFNLFLSAPCTICSDVDRVTQIISNFLSNAEKYASEGKTVDLSVAINSKAKEVCISVRDYGKGVPSSLLTTIFKPFYRLNTSITEGVSGTGIGLTIALQLAKSLGGRIVAINEDKGMRFTLCLPLYKEEDNS